MAMIADIRILKVKRPRSGAAVFSIIIPSWNNLAYLQLCIESIRKHSHFSHQLIVHVNESSDGTLAWIRAQEDIDYTFSKENIGVCYGLNIARDLVATDYILYLNDDMYVCPGWDLVLHEEILRIGHPYFFLSSTSIEPLSSGNPCVVVADFGSDIRSFREKELLAAFASQPKGDWQGATWPPNLVHKDIWDLVGGYSPEFSPGMYSDPDFSFKLWNLGIRYFKGMGASRVYHFGSKSTGRIRRNKGYYRFIQKWGMTSSTLTRYYLRRGQPHDGALSKPAMPLMVRVKNLWKRIYVACRRFEKRP